MQLALDGTDSAIIHVLDQIQPGLSEQMEDSGNLIKKNGRWIRVFNFPGSLEKEELTFRLKQSGIKVYPR